MNDLFYLAQPVVESLFFEDVIAWLDDSDIRYTPKVKFTGISGFDHLFDFVIPKSPSKQPERIVQAINRPTRDTAEVFIYKLSDTREVRPPESKAYAFSMTSISRSQEGVLDAFRNYQIQPAPGASRAKSVDGIVAECAQARYFYLKGALQQTANFEVETDKLQVESFLKKLGFTQDLIQALDAAESNYRATSSAFELKSCVGLLRSVLESTHRDAAKSIAHSLRENPPQDWTTAVRFLVRMGLITPQQEKLVRGLYALLSDEGVHPILAKREFARLLRNMVIEYTLLFLTVLDKKGIAIAGEAGRAGDPGPDDPSKPR